MADEADGHRTKEGSKRDHWRLLLSRMDKQFEEIDSAGEPLVHFLACPNADLFPPSMGLPADHEGCALVEVKDGEGIFPHGVLFPEGNVPFGHFGVPTHIHDSVTTPAWQKFQRLANRAWALIPEAIRAALGPGAPEFRWTALVCKALLDAGTNVVFRHDEFAGINAGVGAAQASAMAIRLLCRTEGDGEVVNEFTPVARHEHDVKQPAQTAKDGRPGDTETGKAGPTQFSGGTLVFFENRVELCGVDICSGRRSKNTRSVLDALREMRGGHFVALSGDELLAETTLKGGQNALNGLMRDLRERISRVLKKEAKIICGRFDVILTGNTGYRFSEKLSVQIADAKIDGRQQGHDARVPVPDDPADDPGNAGHVPNVPDPNDPDVPNLDDPSVPDAAAKARRTWILRELSKGRQLRAPYVKQKFGCSMKTAKRDLQALKRTGQIEFTGNSRTGYYRLMTSLGQADD
jgi:hypothetical protein